MAHLVKENNSRQTTLTVHSLLSLKGRSDKAEVQDIFIHADLQGAQLKH
uniref:Uncharacterized protein n=1 Tax=Arundo donax TaxID=35708 RepID=A0A0A9AXZ5_ARUDO